MDSGTDNRSRLRHHVRAAREWLGRAEDSLDRAEDVRGDLNLMLARAELARAQETERPRASVVWARRLAPLCAAALLAGVGLSVWRSTSESPPVMERPMMERRAEEASVDAGVSRRPRETIPLPAAIPQADAAPAAEMRESVASMPIPEEESRQESFPETTASAAEPTTMEEPAASGPRLPSEEMQRLMSSAGQSLRAIDIDAR